MHRALNYNAFLVKEHAGLFRAANNFDIYDPQTNEKILHCREERLGIATKLLRFTDYKRMTPFEIDVTTPSGEPVFTVKRGISIFLSKVDVLEGETGPRIGGFKQKLFSIGGAFTVLDADNQPICQLKGKWTGWNFGSWPAITSWPVYRRNGPALVKRCSPRPTATCSRFRSTCRRTATYGN
jgi:uncharacterized protein YxjI